MSDESLFHRPPLLQWACGASRQPFGLSGYPSRLFSFMSLVVSQANHCSACSTLSVPMARHQRKQGTNGVWSSASGAYCCPSQQQFSWWLPESQVQRRISGPLPTHKGAPPPSKSALIEKAPKRRRAKHCSSNSRSDSIRFSLARFRHQRFNNHFIIPSKNQPQTNNLALPSKLPL